MKAKLPIVALVLGAATSLMAEVKPSALFSDHMVLQSGMAVPVWGWRHPANVSR